MQPSLLLSTFEKARLHLLEKARSLLGNTEDAEDVLQDVFVKLWQQPQALPPKEMVSLLTTAVRNQSIDELRRRRFRPAELVEGIPDAVPDASDEQDIFPEVERIINAALTPLQQDILRRHDMEGESYETIAETLHMQPTAVRMQLSRARKTIREQYRLRKNTDAP